ncbi:YebC/PmpR family DNA-binding transcriptional regulator [Patescibacteria group bacterium]
MSGHSKWKKIKHQKGAEDVKKSKIFSKIARVIILTTKEGGGDPVTNPKLRFVIETAKKANLPLENIERAIKKGTGELIGGKLEPILVEAYGPGGVAVLIEGITDNKNRALAEIKQVLNQNCGKLASGGSVKWLFQIKGVITIEAPKNKEGLEMTIIEAGAEDIQWKDNTLNVYAKPEELEKVKKNLESKGIEIESVSLDWVAKNLVSIKEKEACQKLFEALDESESVQEIYSNLKD